MMNFKYTAIAFTALSLTVSSCNDFLDEMPDNRTELDTPEKNYQTVSYSLSDHKLELLAEFSSDNTDDNGPKYQIFDRLSREIYEWKDTKETGNDSPVTYWSSCYKAIATANQA